MGGGGSGGEVAEKAESETRNQVGGEGGKLAEAVHVDG